MFAFTVFGKCVPFKHLGILLNVRALVNEGVYVHVYVKSYEFQTIGTTRTWLTPWASAFIDWASGFSENQGRASYMKIYLSAPEMYTYMKSHNLRDCSTCCRQGEIIEQEGEIVLHTNQHKYKPNSYFKRSSIKKPLFLGGSSPGTSGINK